MKWQVGGYIPRAVRDKSKAEVFEGGQFRELLEHLHKEENMQRSAQDLK